MPAASPCRNSTSRGSLRRSRSRLLCRKTVWFQNSATAVRAARRIVWPKWMCGSRSTPNSYSTVSFMVRRAATVLPTWSRSASASLNTVARREDGLGQPEQLGSVSEDHGKRMAHGVDRAHRPDLIEDNPHDEEGHQDADQAVARRSQLRGSRGALDCYHVERKRNLEADITELASLRTPARDEGNDCDENHERCNRIHGWKQEYG